MTTPPIGNATKPRPCGKIHGFKGICIVCQEITKQNRKLAKRGVISKDLRMWVLKRDDFTCRYCNDQAEIADHVIATSRGGKGDPDNLVAACWTCSSRKRNMTPLELIEAYPELYGHLI